MKPRINDSTAEFVYTVNCPMDAFWDIYDAVNEEIDNCLEAGWLNPAINETTVSVYSTIEATLPIDWCKVILTNQSGESLMDYLDIFEEFLADWYDVNQKKTMPGHVSDSQ